ncbi:hypothetical protein NC651_008039 [Populus alba x Populus x berolinensis]|nr:hypothetical protein NC651_008039 [Populus alba x Populus x berolinensis]
MAKLVEEAPNSKSKTQRFTDKFLSNESSAPFARQSYLPFCGKVIILVQLDHALEVVHAQLLPEGKATIIKELKKEGPTAMTGDGLNDAPALAIADIGTCNRYRTFDSYAQ